MSDWFGSGMTRAELRERIGDIAQICDARRLVIAGGRGAGVETVEVTTGGGLAFTVVPSRGLDISRMSYRGVPLSWFSQTGEVSPHAYEPEGYGWLRGFFGGMLTTCGLSWAAHPCEDEGEQLGLHGRASYIPAEDVCVEKNWAGDDYTIAVSGRVREAKVFGDNLILHRRIETRLGASSLVIRDTVENAGFRTSPLMMLYHVNVGWPVLDETARLVAPSRCREFQDSRAEREPDGWRTFGPPQEDWEERVYRHDMAADAEGFVRIAVVNMRRELAVHLRYLKAEFPWFYQWKMLGKGEYVVGIEPGNIRGTRAAMRREGTLEFIEPGAVRTFTLEIGVAAGGQALDRLLHDIGE